jgi:hypothetical protein
MQPCLLATVAEAVKVVPGLSVLLPEQRALAKAAGRSHPETCANV